MVDTEGRLVPRADNTVQFTIEGPGEIVATDNGDPTSFELFTSPERKAFNGLVLVIVKAKKRREPGSLTVTASSAGLGQVNV